MKNKIILVSLLALTLLVCAGSIYAIDWNNPTIRDDSDFTMTARYNGGTAYYWEVSPDSYGVELVSQNNVLDHPNACGSSGTQYFNFKIINEDYFVKLIKVGPNGNIVDEIIY